LDSGSNGGVQEKSVDFISVVEEIIVGIIINEVELMLEDIMETKVVGGVVGISEEGKLIMVSCTAASALGGAAANASGGRCRRGSSRSGRRSWCRRGNSRRRDGVQGGHRRARGSGFQGRISSSSGRVHVNFNGVIIDELQFAALEEVLSRRVLGFNSKSDAEAAGLVRAKGLEGGMSISQSEDSIIIDGSNVGANKTFGSTWSGGNGSRTAALGGGNVGKEHTSKEVASVEGKTKGRMGATDSDLFLNLSEEGMRGGSELGDGAIVGVSRDGEVMALEELDIGRKVGAVSNVIETFIKATMEAIFDARRGFINPNHVAKGARTVAEEDSFARSDCVLGTTVFVKSFDPHTTAKGAEEREVVFATSGKFSGRVLGMAARQGGILDAEVVVKGEGPELDR
jgi:hypothetical protein